MRWLVLCLAMVPVSARADDVVDRVLNDVVLPGVTTFADRTQALADAAKADCTPDAIRAPWNAAMDAWFGIQDLRFGPLEEGSRRQSIAYWPDAEGYRPRVLARILSGQDPILKTPGKYEGEAVPARGLYAIESMIYDPSFNSYTKDGPGCVLVQAASADLASVASHVRDQWRGDFVTVMRTAGDSKNARFLDAGEARQVIFTALMVSLQFDVLERLGLPLGTYDKPRPKRAEARLSGRSQRNLALSIAAHRMLAEAMVPDPVESQSTREDFARLTTMVAALDDPDFSGVDDPGRRFRLEAVQTAMTLLRTEANLELGTALGATMGLNSLDGD